MRAPRIALALAAVATLASSSASAQGLGDAAAREKQKRQAQEPPKKVFTNEDLRSAAKSEVSAPSDPVERERRERALLEAEWRMRFANAREEVAVADAAAWVEGYRIETYNGVAVRVRTRERAETEELRRARHALAELEEEFRRTGLPAAWARE